MYLERENSPSIAVIARWGSATELCHKESINGGKCGTESWRYFWMVRGRSRWCSIHSSGASSHPEPVGSNSEMIIFASHDIGRTKQKKTKFVNARTEAKLIGFYHCQSSWRRLQQFRTLRAKRHTGRKPHLKNTQERHERETDFHLEAAHLMNARQIWKNMVYNHHTWKSIPVRTRPFASKLNGVLWVLSSPLSEVFLQLRSHWMQRSLLC